jgi:ribosomal protein L37E
MALFAMRIIEHTKGHYETQDVEFGKVYRWHSESVTIECEECGNTSTHTRSSLISSPITCECGKDHTTRIREELVLQVLEEDEALHPWRYQHSSEDIGIPF